MEGELTGFVAAGDSVQGDGAVTDWLRLCWAAGIDGAIPLQISASEERFFSNACPMEDPVPMPNAYGPVMEGYIRAGLAIDGIVKYCVIVESLSSSPTAGECQVCFACPVVFRENVLKT